jgi:hypothetical protein
MINETLADTVINELTDGWDNPNFGKDLRDLPLLSELEEFRPELKSLFEEELTKAGLEQRTAEYKPALEAVMRIVAQSVYEAVQSRIDIKTIRIECHTMVEPYSIVYGDGTVKVGADISLLTGRRSPRGVVVSDHKYLARNVLDLKTVSFNGFDSNSELILKREGKPQRTNSEQTIVSPRGESVNFLDKVHARYSAIMSQETTQAIHNQYT